MQRVWAPRAVQGEDKEVHSAPTVLMRMERWCADELWFIGWCNLRRDDIGFRDRG